MKRFLTATIISSVLICIVDFILKLQDTDYYGNYNLYDLYYSFYDGNKNIINMILLMLIVPCVIAYDLFQIENYGYDQQLKLRIGYQDYYKSMIVECIKRSIIFCSILSVILFVYLYGCFSSTFEYHDQSQYFHQNPLINFTLFNFFRLMGFCVLGVLSYVFAGMIKNKYVFVLIPLFIFFVAIFFSSFITGIILNFNTSDFARTLGLSFMTQSLIAPGTIYYGYGFLNSILSCGFYFSIALFVHIIKVKRVRIYG